MTTTTADLDTLRTTGAYRTFYDSLTRATDDAQYTDEALTLQLNDVQSWWDAHAYAPQFDYTDEERAEMLGEIDALRDAIAKRCTSCHGTGNDWDGYRTVPCSNCRGSGDRPDPPTCEGCGATHDLVPDAATPGPTGFGSLRSTFTCRDCLAADRAEDAVVGTCLDCGADMLDTGQRGTNPYCPACGPPRSHSDLAAEVADTVARLRTIRGLLDAGTTLEPRHLDTLRRAADLLALLGAVEGND